MGDIESVVPIGPEDEPEGERLPHTIIQSITNGPKISLIPPAAVTVRQHALDRAIELALARIREGFVNATSSSDAVLEVAKKFETYLLGDLADTNGDSDDDD